MKEKLRIGFVWVRVVGLSLVALYGLVVVLSNVKAHIEPGLYFPLLVGFERPNAIAALVLTAILSVVLFYLGFQLYRAFRELKALREKSRESEELVKARAEVAELRDRAASGATPGSVPLEGQGRAEQGMRESSGP